MNTISHFNRCTIYTHNVFFFYYSKNTKEYKRRENKVPCQDVITITSDPSCLLFESIEIRSTQYRLNYGRFQGQSNAVVVIVSNKMAHANSNVQISSKQLHTKLIVQLAKLSREYFYKNKVRFKIILYIYSKSIYKNRDKFYLKQYKNKN